MPEFIFLMRSDVTDRKVANDGAKWQQYLEKLGATGGFSGGSSIAAGITLKKGVPSVPSCLSIEGFIRISAEHIEAAAKLLEGNPNYEAGGSVELLELSQDE